MTRDEYIFYPALSASRIKKHYTGDISYYKNALNKGASFHHRLLEVSPEHMDSEALAVYKSIVNNPIGKKLWEGSKKEVAQVSDMAICGLPVKGKAMYDIDNEGVGIIADVKTTSCKTLEEFKGDMISHNNHIQAVWFSMVKGTDAKNFYYIGVPKISMKGNVDVDAIFYCRHSDDEIASGRRLIENYIETQWEETQKYLNQRAAQR